MKRIYFVRHAETDSNVQMVFSGSGDNPKLTALGREQAGKAGHELRDRNIVLIVASPLTRTKDTAAIIAKEIDYNQNDIIYNQLFVERSFGYYEGRSHAELKSDHENNTLKNTGETMEEFNDRVVAAVDWLRTLEPDTILVVGHGGFGRMLRIVDRNLLHDDFHIVERFDNCEIDEFTL